MIETLHRLGQYTRLFLDWKAYDSNNIIMQGLFMFNNAKNTDSKDDMDE
jgi:hypothetical protein